MFSVWTLACKFYAHILISCALYAGNKNGVEKGNNWGRKNSYYIYYLHEVKLIWSDIKYDKYFSSLNIYIKCMFKNKKVFAYCISAPVNS